MEANNIEHVLGKRDSNRARTTELLLDAAEELFAESGYHGVGLRDITDQAGVRLASVTDIFGGKEALFREVFLRRSSVINADRLAMLSHFTLSPDQQENVKALVEAFAKPLLERSKESDGWRNYLRLAAQVSTMRMWVLLLIADQFNPMAMVFIGKLHEIFPTASEASLYSAYSFLVSTNMTVFADNRRLNSISEGRLKSEDFSDSYASAVKFLTHGIYGLCQST